VATTGGVVCFQLDFTGLLFALDAGSVHYRRRSQSAARSLIAVLDRYRAL
jgi:hypothetical protein